MLLLSFLLLLLLLLLFLLPLSSRLLIISLSGDESSSNTDSCTEACVALRGACGGAGLHYTLCLFLDNELRSVFVFSPLLAYRLVFGKD